MGLGGVVHMAKERHGSAINYFVKSKGIKPILISLVTILTILILPLAVKAAGSFGPDTLQRRKFNRTDVTRKREYKPGEIIVKFKESSHVLKKAYLKPQNTGIKSIDKLNKKYRVKKQERIFRSIGKKSKNRFGRLLKVKGQLENIYKLSLPKKAKIEFVVKDYKKDPNVEYAEPNFIVETTATTPNDPYYSSQWHLNNTGQNVNGTIGAPDSDIDAPEGWDIAKGNDQVVIAILDTGIDYEHEDLNERIWTNSGEIPGNGIDDDKNGYVDDYRGYDFIGHDSYYPSYDNDPFDDRGHGTFVSGLAGAESNNGQGVTGVDWQAKLLAVKVMDSKGSGSSYSLAKGIHYAVDNGARVINMSLGANGSVPQTVKYALDYAELNGVISVAAAGNSNSAVGWPANYDPVIAVGATDQNDDRTWWSSYGTKLDVVAPGKNMTSTDITGTGGYSEGNYSSGPSGTSFSTPLVSGLVSLIFDSDSNLSNNEVRNAIFNYTDDKGDPGYDYYYGYGRINLEKSLSRPQLPPDTQGPKVTITNPSDGANVCGNVYIYATVDDRSTGNSNILEVKYSIDGGDFILINALDGNYDSPAEGANFLLDTTTLSNDSHTITILGKDANNNLTIVTVILNIVNGSLLDRPKVTITNPSDGANVCGNLNINVSVDDRSTGNSNILDVKYSIDNGQINSMSSIDGHLDSPFENVTVLLDTTTLSNGSHTVTVTGKDINNNWASAMISFNVVNGSLQDKPKVMISNPQNNANIWGILYLGVIVDDRSTGNTNVLEAQYNIDGGSFSSMYPIDGFLDSPIEDMTAQVDTTTLSSGSHTITVIGSDTNKNWETTTIDINVVNGLIWDGPGTYISRVSVNQVGSQANDISYGGASIMADGRYIVFSSKASNLVSGDTNGNMDIFRKDLQTGETTRISTNSSGKQANNESFAASMTPDGRYIAFVSQATNLDSSYTYGEYKIFRKDLKTGEIVSVSANSSGKPADKRNLAPNITPDGRYVAFESNSSDLVPNDTNWAWDVFRKDLQTGESTRISTDSSGNQANKSSWGKSITSDGRYVVFESDASNLINGDTNGIRDIFRKDLQTGETVRVSTDSSGNQANYNGWTPASWDPRITPDGRYVIFTSQASNLVKGDTNSAWDIFLKDLQTGEILRVSTDASGNQANSNCYWPSIIPDGKYIVFSSNASNLVSNDTNGRGDIFRKDLQTGKILRVSTDLYGNQGNSLSEGSSVSLDGRYIAFTSYASNLVNGDVNKVADIFLTDMSLNPSDRSPEQIPSDSAYEPNNSFEEAYTISSSYTYNGFIWSNTDVDYFKININAGENVNINLTSLPDDYDIFLFGPDKTELARSINGGKSNENINLTAVSIGTYYIKIIGYYGVHSVSDDYELKATITPELVPPSITSFTVPTYSTNVSPSLGFNISWSGSDNSAGSGVASYQIQRHNNTTTAWSTIKVDGTDWTAKTKTTFTGTPGYTYYFRARAKDNAGNLSAWSYGKTIVPYDDIALKYSSGWKDLDPLYVYGYKNTLKSTTTKDAYATLAFTGKSVTLIARIGPSRGKVDVYIRDKVNGVWSSYTKVKTIDLYSSTGKNRAPLFIKSWTNASTHQVKFVSTGTKNTSSKSTSVDIDGVAALK
jgi:subtilisin family serine protease/Tol biopolymer transport system component